MDDTNSKYKQQCKKCNIKNSQYRYMTPREIFENVMQNFNKSCNFAGDFKN